MENFCGIGAELVGSFCNTGFSERLLTPVRRGFSFGTMPLSWRDPWRHPECPHECGHSRPEDSTGAVAALAIRADSASLSLDRMIILNSRVAHANLETTVFNGDVLDNNSQKIFFFLVNGELGQLAGSGN